MKSFSTDPPGRPYFQFVYMRTAPPKISKKSEKTGLFILWRNGYLL